nr:MAG TPA: hypothetical protein [Caudoviricetes sp.]
MVIVNSFWHLAIYFYSLWLYNRARRGDANV